MTTRLSLWENRASQAIRLGFVSLLATVPFFAISYVWLGSNLGHITWFKIWPELLIAAITVPCVWLFAADSKLRRTLSQRKVNWLVLAYVLLHVVMAAWRRPETNALIAGLMINLRLVAMLLLGQMVAYYFGSKEMIRTISVAVAIPAFVVVIFGILQITILPVNFLRWFGYDQSTIRPFTSLHQGSTVLRISSTLKGPNPLGAYLAFVISFLLSWLPRKALRQLAIIGLSVTTVALVWTFSRSAWIAALIALALHIYLTTTPARRRRLVQGGLLVMAVFALVAVVFRDNNVIENSILHTDESNVSVDSNDGHWEAFKTGMNDVIENPLGAGPGSAGPASVNLKKSPANLAENYYIQVAQEVGVFGAVLFVLIFGLVMTQLFSKQALGWPHALFISGIGLAVANLLLHVWADDTLGIIWWGLAGYFAYLPPKLRKT